MSFTFQLILRSIKQFIELILPAQCLLCGLASNNKLICHDCLKAITTNRPCCQHCGLTLVKSQPFCGDCLKQAHLFTQLHALADYQKPYPTLIKKFKYSKKLIYGELLAELLSQSVSHTLSPQQLSKIDYLIPVPLHPKKHRQRGFNQAQLIAQHIGKKLNCPVLLDTVQRHKQTIAQEGLSLQKRKANLKNAFIFSGHHKTLLSGAYVVIIDDVVTTGATINSVCQVLLQSGVKRIDIWCICRTGLTASPKKQSPPLLSNCTNSIK